MTIGVQVVELRFALNGASTVFPLTNLIYFAQTDLKVWRVDANDVATPLTLGVDFTLSGDGTAGAGSLTCPGAAGFGAGYTLVAVRSTDIKQNQQFIEGAGFPAKNAENALDRRALIEQEMDRRLGRTIHAPDSDPAVSFTLPPRAARKGKLLGFDLVTGNPSVDIDPVGAALDAAAAAEASAAAAAASEADAETALTLIQNYGTPYASLRNIWELFTTSEIAVIRGGENSQNLAAKVQAAMTANPNTAWFWPEGWYFLDSSVGSVISVPEGIRWVGAGKGVTHIKLGGANASSWGIEQLNINGTQTMRGFKAEHISFLPTWNGIRWNTTTGGYDDTSGTQRYIEDWGLYDCEVLYNGAPSTRAMAQANKCFNGGIERCKFNGGNVQIDIRGSDLNMVRDNRLDNATDTAVQVQSAGPSFGSTTMVMHNDINNPKHHFYYGTDRDGWFCYNHCELDGNPGSTGTGGNQESAILIDNGATGAFKTHIIGNRMEVDQFADRWLRYNSSNPYLLVVEGNGSTGPGTPFADIRTMPYWTNSSTRLVCSHRNNLYLDNDARFPMNYEPGATVPDGVGVVARFTASRPGVTCVGIGQALTCAAGAFKLPATTAADYIEFSDWASLAMPANTLKGTFSLVFLTESSTAAQQLKWAAYDNGVAIAGASGTITHANSNQMYLTAPASFAVATKLQIRVWNEDTGHGGIVYVHAIDVRL